MKSKEPVSPFLAATSSLREKRSSFAVCHSSSGVPRVWFTGQMSQLLSCSHGALSLLFVFDFLSWKLSSSSLFPPPSPPHTARPWPLFQAHLFLWLGLAPASSLHSFPPGVTATSTAKAAALSQAGWLTRRHWTRCGSILGCHHRGMGALDLQVDRDQGCCQMPHDAQDSPPEQRRICP